MHPSDAAVSEILNKLFAGEIVSLVFQDEEEARRFLNMVSVRKSRMLKTLRALDMHGDERLVFKFAPTGDTDSSGAEVWEAKFVALEEPKFKILSSQPSQPSQPSQHLDSLKLVSSGRE